jgi:hypothetical protein
MIITNYTTNLGKNQSLINVEPTLSGVSIKIFTAIFMYGSEQFKQRVSLPEYVNVNCDTIGLDSFEHCFDKKHFVQYGPVRYEFNDLGYRFTPPTQYRGDEILAIGDSFTLGLGVDQDHTWPNQLSQLLDYPVLNFSMNGASNDWIARKTAVLLEYFQPRCVIVHYSFSHRRENNRSDWTDSERTLCEAIHSDEENLANWHKNRDQLAQICGNIPLIHTAIVNWHTQPVSGVFVPKQIDRARDGFHYGPLTHRLFATSLLEIV